MNFTPVFHRFTDKIYSRTFRSVNHTVNMQIRTNAYTFQGEKKIKKKFDQKGKSTIVISIEPYSDDENT